MNKQIGLYLKKEREKLGISQKKLADILHIDRTNVSKWEKGKKVPDEHIDKLCEILKINKKTLITNDNKKSFPYHSILIKNSYKLILIILGIILSIFLIFTFFYFIHNYRSIKYYQVSAYENEFISINNSSLFQSKDSIILNLHLDYLVDIKEIKNIKLFLIDENEPKYFVITQPREFITIYDTSDIQEYFSFRKFKNAIGNMGIEVEFINGNKSNAVLKFQEYYKNSKIFNYVKPRETPNITINETFPNSDIWRKVQDAKNKLDELDLEAITVKYNDIEYEVFHLHFSVSIYYTKDNQKFCLSYLNVDGDEFFSNSIINNKEGKEIYDYSLTNNKCIKSKCDSFKEDYELFNKILDKIIAKNNK